MQPVPERSRDPGVNAEHPVPERSRRVMMLGEMMIGFAIFTKTIIMKIPTLFPRFALGNQ